MRVLAAILVTLSIGSIGCEIPQRIYIDHFRSPRHLSTACLVAAAHAGAWETQDAKALAQWCIDASCEIYRQFHDWHGEQGAYTSQAPSALDSSPRSEWPTELATRL
jgi:hypothetical protein